MAQNASARRAFFARRAIAKRTENTIVIGGVSVTITASNAKFAETLRQKDAERAYEEAAFGRVAA